MTAGLQPLIQIVNSPGSASRRICDPLGSLDHIPRLLRLFGCLTRLPGVPDGGPQHKAEDRYQGASNEDGRHDQATGALVTARRTALMPVRAIA